MLIPLKEWAAKNGLAPNSARAKAKRGMIPATKIGYDWFIEQDAENVDHRRKGAVVEKRKFTNADRIRAMSDEELEQLINKAKFCGGLIERESSSKECHGCKDGFCCDVKGWLQSESEVQNGKL